MAKSSEWNLIRGDRIWEEESNSSWRKIIGKLEGGNFYRSIYPPFQAEIFLRADGREYLYARLFRIKSDYILPRYLCLPNRRNLHGKHEAVVAPLTFEFSRSKERERDCRFASNCKSNIALPLVLSRRRANFCPTILCHALVLP